MVSTGGEERERERDDLGYGLRGGMGLLLRRHPGKGGKERLPSSRREGKEGKKDDQKRNGLFRRRPLLLLRFLFPPPSPHS